MYLASRMQKVPSPHPPTKSRSHQVTQTQGDEGDLVACIQNPSQQCTWSHVWCPVSNSFPLALLLQHALPLTLSKSSGAWLISCPHSAKAGQGKNSSTSPHLSVRLIHFTEFMEQVTFLAEISSDSPLPQRENPKSSLQKDRWQNSMFTNTLHV